MAIEYGVRIFELDTSKPEDEQLDLKAEAWYKASEISLRQLKWLMMLAEMQTEPIADKPQAARGRKPRTVAMELGQHGDAGDGEGEAANPNGAAPAEAPAL